MKIVYVVFSASLSGGMKVIAEHVTGLCDRGHTAEVWGLMGDFNWFPRHISYRLFGSPDELGAALRQTRAAKVATFWVTAAWVAANLMPGERGFYLIQDEDELTYSGSDAGTSYRLGLVPITEGEFVTQEIERKYGTTCHNVGIGIDHRIYNPLPLIRERFQVLTPARINTAGPASLKGWDTAAATLEELHRIEPRASAVTFGMEQVAALRGIPHVHVPSPTDPKLRELYSQSGVFLCCSRHEGFGLPQLEAMACGCPTVTTDAHGNREYARDGETSLVRDRDPRQLAEAIASVMNDDGLAARLSIAGKREAARYQWGGVIERLESVLREHLPVKESAYKYKANDDDLAELIKCFTSRNGDGSGDPEENFFSCLKLVACCKSGCEFLDIGSGHGRIVDIVRRYAAHVVALEPDTERFRSCQKSFSDVHHVEVHNSLSSEYRTANPGKTFDVITLSMVLQHVSTRQSQGILEDIRDLLAPNGVAIISTTHFFKEQFAYQGRSVPVSVSEFDRYAEDTSSQEWGIPVRMFSKQSFVDALRHASLEIIVWNQFFYVRAEKVEAYANMHRIPPDAIRDVGYSQFAVVRNATAPTTA